MTMSVLTPSFTANGNINPCRFVKVSGPLKISQCSVAGERAFGISQEGLMDTPIPGASSALAAEAGRHVGVFGPGETCLVQVASAVVSGNLLKGDANGKAVATSTANDIYNAIALEDQATVDGRVLCFIQSGKV